MGAKLALVPGGAIASLPDLDGDGRRGGSDHVVGVDSTYLEGVASRRLTGCLASHFSLTCRPEVAAWTLAALQAWQDGTELSPMETLRAQGPVLCGGEELPCPPPSAGPGAIVGVQAPAEDRPEG